MQKGRLPVPPYRQAPRSVPSGVDKLQRSPTGLPWQASNASGAGPLPGGGGGAWPKDEPSGAGSPGGGPPGWQTSRSPDRATLQTPWCSPWGVSMVHAAPGATPSQTSKALGGGLPAGGPGAAAQTPDITNNPAASTFTPKRFEWVIQR